MKTLLKTLFLLCAVHATGWAMDPGANAICLEHSFTDQQIECMNQLRPLTFHKSVYPLCQQFSFVREKQDCMASLGDASFDVFAVRACNQLSFNKKKRDCMIEFKNMRLDHDQAPVCMQLSFPAQRITCLKKAATAEPFNPSHSVSDEKLLRMLDNAINAVENGNRRKMKRILNEILHLVR